MTVSYTEQNTLFMIFFSL